MAVAILAPAFATLATLPLQALTRGRTPFAAYLLGVLAASLWSGWRAGAGALVLSAIAAQTLFMPVHGLLFVLQDIPQDRALTLFGAFGVLVIGVGEHVRRRAVGAREARGQLLESRRRLHEALRAAEQEIADRRRVEQQLRASEERFRLAASAMCATVYEWDCRTGEVERSAGLEALIGYRPDEAEPTQAWWYARVHPEDRGIVDLHATGMDGMAERGETTFTHEYRIRHRDGRWLWIQTHNQIVRDDAGRIVRIVGCAFDIDARRRAEGALEEANRRKDEFLATLAHELRNPLAPIRTAAHLLAAPSLAPARREQARAMIERQAQGLTRLVDDLLEVSRLTLGRITLQRESQAIGSVVEQALEVAGPLAQAKSQQLRVELPEHPVIVLADATRLSQVLVNLLANAVKYTPAGGEIGLHAGVDGDEAVVRVRDTGIGIPSAMLERVFEMFTQVRRADGARAGGLGIGLALARRLVEMHGGRIEAHSAGEGRGSEFVVRLPLVGAPVQRAPVAAVAGGATRRPAGRRVLVVDDNIDAADSLRISLELLGHRVTVAYDGVAGLEAGLAAGFDVALLDIGLPRMDGYVLARNLRAALRDRCPQLVALTGWGQAEDRRRAEEAGFDVHLTKPADPIVIGNILEQSRTSAAA